MMKVLYVTTIGKTMGFFESFIKELVDAGHTVNIAANENNSMVPVCYREWGCNVYQIDFSRSPLSSDNIKAYGQLKNIVENGNYDIVHCHTPNASVITRLACRSLRRKKGLKVFYTAHGFHFCKGAPIRNWMIFYPIEKFCSHFTDKLITINKEDYERAKNKLKAKEVHYVPGVGIDLTRFGYLQTDRFSKRREIGVPEDAFMLLSVGELNSNKNHQVIVKALAQLKNPKIHYVIAGLGDKKEYLLELAKSLGVAEQLHLVGYRNDISELNCSADVFCFPSMREGLGLAAIEAMACGLPLITSNMHGINDYSIDSVTGYKCDACDILGFSSAIKKLYDDCYLRMEMGQKNVQFAKKYDIYQINPLMKEIYRL